MDYYQIPKDLLLVDNEQTIDHLHGQAMDIAGYGRTLDEGGVLICMMHQPQKAQLADLYAQRDKLNMPIALVGGQLGLMTQLIPCLAKQGFAVFEAKTDRISKEETQPDGSVKRVSIFQHAGLRRLA